MIRQVEVLRVSRIYGATPALRGISATFLPHTITLIEGPNGSGKSTLLGLLSTAIRPTTGQILWHPFGSSPELARPHIGWLSHESLVYPDLSGIENLTWSARLHGLTPEALDPLTDRLHLGSFARRPVRTMSRGQRQRIAIARALLSRPSLLLLDEPTTGLDREGITLLVRIIREEAERGAIVAIIAHDLELGTLLGATSLRLERGQQISPSISPHVEGS
ncbi:MAG: ABC transporter ATP-binding protein [Myxococcales bacterium]|nr:ABC transporter ATP-binding protein [Polyangiaceae bacterium]MDW8251314.1 ABC transporter ATP-binding protein [Myxococcales bacterium]